MTQPTVNNNSGIGCAGLLFVVSIIFVTLKLAGVIAWSWWLVLLPALIPITFTIVAFIFLVIAAVFLNKE